MFSAQIVGDSISPQRHRATTFVITFPRIILAELNTHRMLSKNSASSRAIPTKKMIKSVLDTPFIPIKWMKEHTGMQGTEYFEDDQLFNLDECKEYMFKRLSDMYRETKEQNEEDIIIDERVLDLYNDIFESLDQPGRKYTLDDFWLFTRDEVLKSVLLLYSLGVTKQVCNRLLEPFMWHTVIITGTDWENFFALRAHPAAEIHMQEIAYLMLQAYNDSTPVKLLEGQWHIPYFDKIDKSHLKYLTNDYHNGEDSPDEAFIRLAIKVSTVMCARTSYTVVGSDQKPMTYPKMFDLHDDMAAQRPLHASPFEHCAQVSESDDYIGNFKGFKQYRKMLLNENSIDHRVIKK